MPGRSRCTHGPRRGIPTAMATCARAIFHSNPLGGCGSCVSCVVMRSMRCSTASRLGDGALSAPVRSFAPRRTACLAAKNRLRRTQGGPVASYSQRRHDSTQRDYDVLPNCVVLVSDLRPCFRRGGVQRRGGELVPFLRREEALLRGGMRAQQSGTQKRTAAWCRAKSRLTPDETLGSSARHAAIHLRRLSIQSHSVIGARTAAAGLCVALPRAVLRLARPGLGMAPEPQRRAHAAQPRSQVDAGSLVCVQ